MCALPLKSEWTHVIRGQLVPTPEVNKDSGSLRVVMAPPGKIDARILLLRPGTNRRSASALLKSTLSALSCHPILKK